MPSITCSMKKDDIQKFDNNQDFQTPEWLANYMASFIPENAGTILEPTPGAGNLVKAIQGKGSITAPKDFFKLSMDLRFDWCIMNPPYNPRSLCNSIFLQCMEQCDNIIALIPYDTITNAQKRHRKIMHFGLKEIIHIDRYKAFKNIRVNICIMIMERGYKGETIFKSLPQKLK